MRRRHRRNECHSNVIELRPAAAQRCPSVAERRQNKWLRIIPLTGMTHSMSAGRDIRLSDESLRRITLAIDAVMPLIGENRGSAPRVGSNCCHGMKSAFAFGEGNDDHDNVLARTRTVLARRPWVDGQRRARGGRGRVASATGDAGSSCGSDQRCARNRLRRATRNKNDRSARCAAASGTVRERHRPRSSPPCPLTSSRRASFFRVRIPPQDASTSRATARCDLHGDGCSNSGMRIVIQDLEVLELVIGE